MKICSETPAEISLINSCLVLEASKSDIFSIKNLNLSQVLDFNKNFIKIRKKFGSTEKGTKIHKIGK